MGSCCVRVPQLPMTRVKLTIFFGKKRPTFQGLSALDEVGAGDDKCMTGSPGSSQRCTRFAFAHQSTKSAGRPRAQDLLSPRPRYGTTYGCSRVRRGLCRASPRNLWTPYSPIYRLGWKLVRFRVRSVLDDFAFLMTLHFFNELRTTFHRKKVKSCDEHCRGEGGSDWCSCETGRQRGTGGDHEHPEVRFSLFLW